MLKRFLEWWSPRGARTPLLVAPLPVPAVAPRSIVATAALPQLVHRGGLLGYRHIGPAVALDAVRYMPRRSAAEDALAEALAMFLLPQLEGLEQGNAREVYKLCISTLTGWTSEEVLQKLRARR